MRPIARILALVLLILGLGWGAYVATAPAPPPLAGLVPRGALLYLEAKDLQSLLNEWNASPQKREWLKSAGLSAFSRSALSLRLEKAQKDFAAAASVPPDMKFLAEAAGRESALGLYDIGKLEFLYITRLPSGRAMQSALWSARTKFESRSAAGVPFFVHSDAESARTVAFAVTDEYLILATREDLIASSLALISGSAGQPITGEQWFSKALSAASHPPGDLRMVLNLEKIVATPHFRTYWIERNVTELKQYSAAVSDLYRTGSDYREERVLLRNGAAPATATNSAGGFPRGVTPQGEQATGDLTRLVPGDAGVYRAFANPTPVESLALLEEKILSPKLGPAPAEKLAPGVTLGEVVSGSAADLETRIDEAPAERVNLKGSTSALLGVLEKAGIEAALSVQSSRTDPANAFVTLHSAIVFHAAADWSGDAVRTALSSAVEPALSTAALGVGWQPNGAGPDAVYALDGLMPLRVVTRGRYLFVSNDAGLLTAALAGLLVRADTQNAVYAAGFNHALERDKFTRLTRTLDRADLDSTAASPGVEREPYFFSENISSLSHSLAAVNSFSVNVRESGSSVLQTVTYHWSQ